MYNYDIKNIISHFKVKGNFMSFKPFGCGHINDTCLVTFDYEGKTKKYIFQRINNEIFPDVDKLMNNIKLVTDFICDKLEQEGKDKKRQCLNLIYTNDDLPFYFDNDSKSYFRVLRCIDNATAYQKIDNPEYFYQAALAFAEFAKNLNDFDAKSLYTILPNFHNTGLRYKTFLKSVKNDVCGRTKNVQNEINFVKDRKKYMNIITKVLGSSKMPYRVTHNDTKLNNVLIDNETGKYCAVLDLDTIMPGSICYDFGDAIRFGCNTADEDERDLSKVHFDINLYDIYVKGYLEVLDKYITKTEKEYLPISAIIMTLECGMRFLTDYLDGDKYFKISRDNQNLDRARTQFKLIEEMEEKFTEMQKIVNKY